jgi:hypothetical protein
VQPPPNAPKHFSELLKSGKEGAMDDVEGMDKLDDWQNKCAKYIEGTLI